MSSYLKNVLTAPVPQNEKLTDSQIKNSAGGYVWAVDPFTRLNRFLILGSEGGSYYATERKLTLENTACIDDCLASDPQRTIKTIVAVSDAGRAPKNDMALFALAKCAASRDIEVRRDALSALLKVARIPTHLFDFLTYLDSFRGLGGRSLRTAIDQWYFTKSANNLAYQVTKYRQRNGWTHRDVFRVGHPSPHHDPVRENLYHWIANENGWDEIGEHEPEEDALKIIWAFEKAKRAKNASEIVPLIEQYGLTREMIPTTFLNDKNVWNALLTSGTHGMPLEAMIRNLGVMSANGLLTPLSEAVGYVVGRLDDKEAIVRARLHPIKILSAMLTYQSGRGIRGSNVWTPVTQVIDALDAAFYKAFAAVEPTNKRHVLALDVSGSMSWSTVAGVPGLTPRVASAAMALVTAATEPRTVCVAFTSGYRSSYVSKGNVHRFSMGEGITQFDISPKMRLTDVIEKTAKLPVGGTDCALPMLWAKDTNIEADAFVTYTDSESWFGSLHPKSALDEYRAHSGIQDAKNAVMAMVSNGFSIADPNDPNMIDFCGFDTSVPTLLAEFVQGNI